MVETFAGVAGVKKQAKEEGSVKGARAKLLETADMYTHTDTTAPGRKMLPGSWGVAFHIYTRS